MCDIRKSKKSKECKLCKIVFVVCLAVSIGLIIGGFLMPPKGVIDGSILKAVGELIAFAALAFGWRAVELGYDLKINHGNTTVELNND